MTIRTIRAMSAAVAALTILCIAASTCAADVDTRPIVVLRIDDCLTTWLTPYSGLDGLSAFAYGKRKRIPITWAVIASQATSGTSLSWSQIKDYLDTCGGEAASHSVNHRAMLSTQEYIDELINSKAAIQANLPGYQCTTFLQPGTWTGDAYMDRVAKLDGPIGQAIQANYQQSMAYLGQGWRVGGTYYRYGMTYTFAIDAQANMTVAGLRNTLDVVAATPGLVCVISGHGVQESGQHAEFKVPADILKATMDKLYDLREQNKIRLLGFSEACNTVFPLDLNHVPDAGLETIDPSLIKEPWKISGTAAMVAPGGVEDSRYCALPDSGAQVQTAILSIAPGRYEVSWHQKLINNKLNNAVICFLTSFDQGAVTQRSCIDWAFFYSSSPTTWEKKTALVLIPDRLNMSQLTLKPGANAGYGIDDVSILAAPLDPAVSPSASTVVPAPGQATISWHTPADAQIRSIVVRYNPNTHPLTPTSGTQVLNKPAATNANQQFPVSFDWTTKNNYYFSIFGVRQDGSYTPPDLVAIKADRTGPTTPEVTLANGPDGAINAQWSSSEPDSQIVAYQYAVGNSPADSSIKPWTTCTGTSVTLTGLPTNRSVCVSVSAENTFGVWSSVGSAWTAPPVSIAGAFALEDGATVTVSGYVTAVFANCAYIETANRLRGIKVIGDVHNYREGSFVTVSGTLDTPNGERCLVLP